MFDLKKPHFRRHTKQDAVNPGQTSHSGSSPPLGSNDKNIKSSNTVSSEPTQDARANLFDDGGKQASSQSGFLSARNKYKNDFKDTGGLDNQSVQELESYAGYKSEETTKTVNSCLKIAEDMRETATKTMIELHDQGEKLTRTHMAAADIDHDLSRGEKLMGSLGGMFSKTWKPTKNRPISGPTITRDEVQRKGDHLQQREKLGLTATSKANSNARTTYAEPTDVYQKIEVEKSKQDDSLSELSSVLDSLKDMAVDMGSEIDRQNKALDPFADDIDELNSRVKGVSQRGRRLLGK
ncbi:SNAP25 homologous protein SNAP33-like [Impatiens glandulifera]|uniref:SNAP25 homologous protein SNAP33-like n=1 Tax=Impatiens glandulifera TaxID=253017 RepID=UPI001FB08C46|nr:SNAP25 homologous protein SNAP33-like [Impatiens glandulifera]